MTLNKKMQGRQYCDNFVYLCQFRVEVALFDIDGKPCDCKEGYSRWTAKYDNWGNRTEVIYFDINGNLLDL